MGGGEEGGGGIGMEICGWKARTDRRRGAWPMKGEKELVVKRRERKHGRKTWRGEEGRETTGREGVEMVERKTVCEREENTEL